MTFFLKNTQQMPYISFSCTVEVRWVFSEYQVRSMLYLLLPCYMKCQVLLTYLTNPTMHQNISHNAPFCNRNVYTWAHFCYKTLHCGIWVGALWDLCNTTILSWYENPPHFLSFVSHFFFSTRESKTQGSTEFRCHLEVEEWYQMQICILCLSKTMQNEKG